MDTLSIIVAAMRRIAPLCQPDDALLKKADVELHKAAELMLNEKAAEICSRVLLDSLQLAGKLTPARAAKRTARKNPPARKGKPAAETLLL